MSKRTIEDFLNLQRLEIGSFYTSPPLAETRRKEGQKLGRTSAYIVIGINDVWSATGKDKSSVSSYETLGYHSGSVAFLQGVYDVACPVFVVRELTLEDGRFGGFARYRINYDVADSNKPTAQLISREEYEAAKKALQAG